MGNSIPAYIKHLKSFAARHTTLRERIETLVGQGDFEALRRHAHDLKGEVGNLGMETLHRLAEALEHRIKAGEIDDALTVSATLSAECEALLPSIATLAPPSYRAEHVPDTALQPAFFDDRRLAYLLEKLGEQLSANDPDAQLTLLELECLVKRNRARR